MALLSDRLCSVFLSIPPFVLFWGAVGFLVFLRQGFSVALEPVLELALVDQASLELTEIRLPLPPECWD